MRPEIDVVKGPHRRIYTLESEHERMAQSDTEALRAEVARLRQLENMRRLIEYYQRQGKGE